VITARLPARPQSAALARERVRELLGADAGEDFTHSCVLVVSELVANAAEHAQEPAQATVDLGLELTPVGLAVTVSDSGSGLRLSPVQREERGLGLNIVTAIAHDYTIASTPDGTTIRVLVARPSA
jgi:serine/threonine-protein kinase RsbW